MPGKYDFDKATREYIIERDNRRCIVCGSTSYLGIAHIFVSRAKGGRGIRSNGVVLCQRCHHNLDNGRSEPIQNRIRQICENYLHKRENVDLDKIKDKGR